MVARAGHEKSVPERRSGKGKERENSIRFQYPTERIQASVRGPLQYGTRVHAPVYDAQGISERRLEKRVMRHATKQANPFPKGIPETFAELVSVWVPRAIHDRAEFENAMEIIDAIAGFELNSDQEDYLETVSILADEYDRKHNPQPARAKPVEVLRHLVEDHNLSSRALGRILGKDESLGSKILAGERAITVDHAVTLAKHFGIRPETFLDLR
jgi:HTH-type transcriptional regulator / antitoxin HigA